MDDIQSVSSYRNTVPYKTCTDSQQPYIQGNGPYPLSLSSSSLDFFFFFFSCHKPTTITSLIASPESTIDIIFIVAYLYHLHRFGTVNTPTYLDMQQRPKFIPLNKSQSKHHIAPVTTSNRHTSPRLNSGPLDLVPSNQQL